MTALKTIDDLIEADERLEQKIALQLEAESRELAAAEKRRATRRAKEHAKERETRAAMARTAEAERKAKARKRTAERRRELRQLGITSEPRLAALAKLDGGNYEMSLTRVPTGPADAFVSAMERLGWTPREIQEIQLRVEHVDPEIVAAGLSLEASVAVKTDLERAGASVRLRETGGGIGRETVPKAVREEVWRRDGAKCVECGSNKNLEYDHMVPIARGGSNSARNIRLLCETCNRRKGASI